jgi:hypothetical protein
MTKDSVAVIEKELLTEVYLNLVLLSTYKMERYSTLIEAEKTNKKLAKELLEDVKLTEGLLAEIEKIVVNDSDPIGSKVLYDRLLKKIDTDPLLSKMMPRVSTSIH